MRHTWHWTAITRYGICVGSMEGELENEETPWMCLRNCAEILRENLTQKIGVESLLGIFVSVDEIYTYAPSTVIVNIDITEHYKDGKRI